MTLIIAGGRDYKFTSADIARLDALAKERGVMRVYTGGEPGADECGSEWAASRDIEARTFAAQWKRYGASAGPIRNREMANAAISRCEPVIVVLFPGGKGTADMASVARERGFTIEDWRDNGETQS